MGTTMSKPLFKQYWEIWE